MTTSKRNVSVLLAVLTLAACVSMPEGPSVLVLPGSAKNFDQFRLDDLDCRQFASAQINNANPNNVAVNSGVRSAALGTVLGAVAGAAANGNRGASVGAGTGLLFGGLAGTGAGESSAYGLQRRYDYGYQQCMYVKGNRVPVYGALSSEPQVSPLVQTPPPGTPPPSAYPTPTVPPTVR